MEDIVVEDDHEELSISLDVGGTGYHERIAEGMIFRCNTMEYRVHRKW